MKRLHILRLITLILRHGFLLGVVRLLLGRQLADLLLQEIVLSLQVLDLQQQQVLLIDVAPHQLGTAAGVLPSLLYHRRFYHD